MSTCEASPDAVAPVQVMSERDGVRVPRLGSKPILWRLFAQYGPIVSLRIGSRLAIFVADRHLAQTALVERGAGLENCPVLASARLLGESDNTITHASYGAVWRLLRCNLIAETLHPSRVRLFAPARAWVRSVLAEKLREDSAAGAAVVEMFHYAILCLLVLMCFGKWLDEPAVRTIATAQRDPLIYRSRKMAVFSFLSSITKHLFRDRMQNMQAMQR